ncbi:MAG: gliding motility-associated C-terminal domain-containing protein [Bacteroidia bacterium]|nr:gliding motility-associated C-terminal domain-containing protein [Bacteroidia bacterium]
MQNAFAQTTYKMGNAKVYACKGKLTDSEGNLSSPKKYANNENYKFTVCVKGASTITVKFNGAFCSESVSDFLKVYKGADTTGTLIRTYTGTINSPISITTSDTCITFYFHSDANIVCDGWDLDWEAKITSVPQPKFTAIADPDCNTNKIRVTLDQKFNCDSVKASNFKLTGTLSTAVSSVTAINCDSKNETNTFDVTFASGLNKSGNYLLDFTSSFKDACDSVWTINAKLNFKISNCPILVDLKSNKYLICKGSCANLTATVTGGNSTNYSYTWLSGSLTGAPPKTVCPLVDTRYILQVNDGVSVPGLDTVDIQVADPPVAQNDTTVCQSNSPFNLSASPAGGTWSGNGIIDANLGTFSPSAAGAGIATVYYTIGSCSDSVKINVRAINAGSPNAACPGSSPFMVTNFSPVGGTWSGPNITSAGLITPPSTSGSFVVTYTWNGCTSNKTINIDGIILPNHFDTICKSKTADTLKFSPKGGTWSGPNITNSRLGINNPNLAGAGNKQYIYTINGCKDTLKRTIQDVDARWDEIACPDAGQRVLPAGLPSGGLWSGKGIVDPIAGIFDADSFQVPGKVTYAASTLIYTAPNGCTDSKIMYLRYTNLFKDMVKNCVSDTAYFMRYQYLLNDPWNLLFTGSSGIVGTTVYNQKFNPALAGRGTYNQIIADGNGCKDTMIIYVYPRANIQKDTSACIADNAFTLFNGAGAGVFSGKGIIHSSGVFNPATAGVGTHKIYFNQAGKCTDTVIIKVNPLPVAKLNGLIANYCLRDTAIPLTLSPKGGVLTGVGIVDTVFNPKWAGTGNHTITYKVGTGKCVHQTSFNLDIADTLRMSLTISKDTICIGTPITLSTLINGGSGTYNIKWSSGEYNVQNVYTFPKKSTNYRVVLKDGCSDSIVRIAQLYVHPQLYGSVTTSAINCYGNKGTANLTMNAPGSYTYVWNTIPQQTTASISANVGTTYKVKVTNTQTGCTYDTFATIPGYPRIRAYFAISPSGQCIYSNNPTIQIINLSEGGTNGIWTYGDGTQQAYDPNINPGHTYPGDSDQYTIRLIISNDGGCTDSFKLNVCVLDTVALFIPNAFSPNDDGSNDVFKIESGSVTKANIQIYNRWGEKVFETDDPKQGWDGRYGGNYCPNDYYVYVIRYKGKKTPWRYQRGYFYIIR